MSDNRKISIAIPTWERAEMTCKAFANVLYDERISEIVISDDCSSEAEYDKLAALLKNVPKVKIRRNEQNLDCYENKFVAVANCVNEWVILFDSDNTLTKEYIDAIFSIKEWEKGTFYLPGWAKPAFDYRRYEGLEITRENVNDYFDMPFFSTMLNTANFFVNRKDYVEAFDPFVNPNTADSIYINYRHLAEGGRLFVVPNLHYYHLIHNGSHYINNNYKTGNFYREVEEKIKALK